MKKIVIIGAAKSGYAEAITRKFIKENYLVIGTYDSEFEDNANKLQEDFSEKQLKLIKVDLTNREELKNFVNSIEYGIDGFVFAQFYFEMEDPNNFDYTIWDKSLAINLTAPNFLVNELKSKMIKDSSIVIASMLYLPDGLAGKWIQMKFSINRGVIHPLEDWEQIMKFRI